MSKVNYQFMFLTGAVLFSLSALPVIHKTEKVYSTDLLSSGCDLVGQMVKEGTALCDVKRNNVNAKIIVVKSEKNPDYAEVTTEVECKLGCEDGVRRDTKTVSIKNLESLQKVGDAAVEAATKKMAVDNRKAEEIEKKKELCLVNENNEKFQTQAEVVDCRVDKLAAMEDEAKATKYYRDHVQKQLEDLIKSRSHKDREMAKEALNKLGSSMSISCRPRSMPTGMTSNFVDMSNLSFQSSEKSAISDRGYIEESACDMLAFSGYTQNLESLRANLDFAKANGLSANDPRVIQTMTFASQQEATWGNYFRQRGLELNAPGMGPSGSMLFGSVENNNAFYTSNYNEIIRAHQGLLNPQGATVTPSANAPQFAAINDPRYRQQAVQAANGKVTNPQTQTLPRNAWPAVPQATTTQQSATRGAVTPVPAGAMQIQSGRFSVPTTVPMTVPLRR
jgi:hypothetical protein